MDAEAVARQQQQLLDIVTETVGLYSNKIFAGTIQTLEEANATMISNIDRIITEKLGSYEDILGIVEMLKQKIKAEIKKPQTSEYLRGLGITESQILEVLEFRYIYEYIQGKKNEPEKRLILQRMTDNLAIPGYEDLLNERISQLIPPYQGGGAASLKKRRKRKKSKKSKRSKKLKRVKRVKRSKRSIKKRR